MKTINEEIDNIIKKRYNDYGGALYGVLRETHQIIRGQVSDNEFLEFLKKCETENQKPIYKLPEEIQKQLER